MNAAQRARKRWNREKGKVAGPEEGTEQRQRQQWHYFDLGNKDKALEMEQGLRARGKEVAVLHRPHYELPWQVKTAASSMEMRAPGMCYEKYQTFAEHFGGEYRGLM